MFWLRRAFWTSAIRLRRQLSSKEPGTRARATWEVGTWARTKDTKRKRWALRLLESCLEDPAPEVRLQAVYTLDEFPIGQLFALVQKLMTDGDSKVRSHALVVLADAVRRTPELDAVQAAKLHGDLLQFVGPLSKSLRESPDSETRRAAAVALGAIGDPRAIGAIVPLLQDRDRISRQGSASALKELGWEPEDLRQRMLLAWAAGEADSLATDEAIQAEMIARALKIDPVDPWAHDALSKLGWSMPLEKLREILKSERVMGMAFSRDGQRLAVGMGSGWGPGIRVCAVNSGDSPIELLPPSSRLSRPPVSCLAFSPSGRLAAGIGEWSGPSSAHGAELLLWDDLSAATPARLWNVRGHTQSGWSVGCVESLAFSRDDDLLAAHLVSGLEAKDFLSVWDLKSRSHEHYALKEPIAVVRVDGDLFILGRRGVYDVAAARSLDPRAEQDWHGYVISPDKKTMAVYRPETQGLKIWDCSELAHHDVLVLV